MKRILIFAGTTEGRELADFLKNHNAKGYISTATEYGRSSISPHENLEILSGRMDMAAIIQFIGIHKIDLVIDATHPFAAAATENIRQACAGRIEYIRCLREPGDDTDHAEARMVWVASVAEAVHYLKGTKGKILIATGSKELSKYTEIAGYRERCYARVLSVKESIEESIRLGFEGQHLIAMQGPYSIEMNVALLNQTGAKYFVTKESGAPGGYEEKRAAAEKTGTMLVVIGRPKEQGSSPEEVMAYLNDYLK